MNAMDAIAACSVGDEESVVGIGGIKIHNTQAGHSKSVSNMR